MPTKAPPLNPWCCSRWPRPCPCSRSGWRGGAWVWLGLFYMTAFTALLDQALSWLAPDAPEGTAFSAAVLLLIVLGLSHLA